MNKIASYIKNTIRDIGAIPMDYFLSIVIPSYYQNQEHIGKNGDFITAPEISQMFGEVIAAYSANHWLQQHNHKSVTIIELGAGNGTMMSDFMRVAQKIPAFYNSIDTIGLYDFSSKLRAVQQQNLERYKDKYLAFSSFESLEEYCKKHSCIFIANEFFDSLPIKQYCYIENVCHELYVDINESDRLCCKFIKSTPHSNEHPTNCIIETTKHYDQYLSMISQSIKDNTGLSIIIDYGYIDPPYKSTLQAMHKHHKVDLFKNIGECDITHLVNFHYLENFFQRQGITSILQTQQNFLLSCNIQERAAQLIQKNPTLKTNIEWQTEMLLGQHNMGELFKVIVNHN